MSNKEKLELFESSLDEMFKQAREQARRNTERNRDSFAAELEAASKKSPRELMREFAESI